MPIIPAYPTDNRIWRYRVDYPRRNSDARISHKFTERAAALDFVATNYPGEGAAIFDRATGCWGRVMFDSLPRAKRDRVYVRWDRRT